MAPASPVPATTTAAASAIRRSRPRGAGGKHLRHALHRRPQLGQRARPDLGGQWLSRPFRRRPQRWRLGRRLWPRRRWRDRWNGALREQRSAPEHLRYRLAPRQFGAPILQHALRGRPQLAPGTRPDLGGRRLPGRIRAGRGGGGWDGGYGGRDDRPGNGYAITCASDDRRLRTCAWDGRYGRPVLTRQLSDTRCAEGRTWGYDDRRATVWVNDGCRARFEAR